MSFSQEWRPWCECDGCSVKLLGRAIQDAATTYEWGQNQVTDGFGDCLSCQEYSTPWPPCARIRPLRIDDEF